MKPKLNYKALSLIILFFALALIAYELFFHSFSNRILERSIYKSFEEKGSVDITEITRFDWEDMYVFGPYAPKDHINETVGFEAIKYGLGSTGYDELQLVLFTRNDRVIRRLSVETEKANFVKLRPEAVYTYDDAYFEISSLEGFSE